MQADNLQLHTFDPLNKCSPNYSFKSILKILLALAASSAGGCQTLALPRLFDPTPISYRQSRAQQFDPFPENEPGPPIVGARPREFDRPLPEARRAKLLPWWARANP